MTSLKKYINLVTKMNNFKFACLRVKCISKGNKNIYLA